MVALGGQKAAQEKLREVTKAVLRRAGTRGPKTRHSSRIYHHRCVAIMLERCHASGAAFEILHDAVLLITR
jgi:hypothetical protein